MTLPPASAAFPRTRRARGRFSSSPKFGLYGITTESVDAIATIEKLVKEYIRVGFHDHQSQLKNSRYKMVNPNCVLNFVKDRDARIEQLCNAGTDQFEAKLAEFANGTVVIKTAAKSVDLAKSGAKLAQGEQHRRIRMEELMRQREQQFPNETYQERWNKVVTSDEGQGILDQMNAAKALPTDHQG